MKAGALRRAVRSPFAIDAALTLFVAIISYAIAYRSLSAFAAVPWIEDLLLPCTGRPGWVPNPETLKALPQWQAFMSRQLEYFPCQALSDVPLVEIGVGWQQSEYFHRALGLWFQFRGPTIEGFISFQAAFHAATCSIAYLVFRLGLWRIVALAGAAAIASSSWHLTAVALPIEYAKAPWMLASVGLCGLVLRRDAQGQSLWASALALGLVSGIGIGFKADLMAAVPLALVTTSIFVRRTPSGPSRRVLATSCVLAGVALGGGGVMWRTFQGEAGSVLAVQFLGGLDSATERMHAINPLYDYGLAFDDSHITVLINSYAQRVLGATEPAYFFSRAMQHASVQLLSDIWTTFPGDLVLRVIASTLRIVQLNGYGLPIAVGGLFLVFVKDLRVGWFIAVATVYLSAYVSLVFQRRHFYHLEFISWGLAGVLVQTLCMSHRLLPSRLAREQWRLAARRVLAAALSLALIAVVAVAALVVARIYQQAAVLRLIEDYTRVPREERRVLRVDDSSGNALVSIDGITATASDPTWRLDEMTGDYAVLTFGCWQASPITITAKYRPPGAAWDRTFSIPCVAPGETATLMLPIYQYGATYRFDALLMSDRATQAIRSAAIMTPDARVRLWLPLLIPADWRRQTWSKTLRMPLETP